jgi:hypothetical protein
MLSQLCAPHLFCLQLLTLKRFRLVIVVVVVVVVVLVVAVVALAVEAVQVEVVVVVVVVVVAVVALAVEKVEVKVVVVVQLGNGGDGGEGGRGEGYCATTSEQEVWAGSKARHSRKKHMSPGDSQVAAALLSETNDGTRWVVVVVAVVAAAAVVVTVVTIVMVLPWQTAPSLAWRALHGLPAAVLGTR